MRRLVSSDSDTDVIYEEAKRGGMRPLWDAAIDEAVSKIAGEILNMSVSGW